MKNNFNFVVTKVENGYTKLFSVSKVETGANYSHLCYSTSITAYQTNFLDMDRKCTCCLRNKAARNRTKCATCEKRLQREKYPVKAADVADLIACGIIKELFGKTEPDQAAFYLSHKLHTPSLLAKNFV